MQSNGLNEFKSTTRLRYLRNLAREIKSLTDKASISKLDTKDSNDLQEMTHELAAISRHL